MTAILSRGNESIFFQNTKNELVARSWGCDMGYMWRNYCVISVIPFVILCCMQFRVMLDRFITKLDCATFRMLCYWCLEQNRLQEDIALLLWFHRQVQLKFGNRSTCIWSRNARSKAPRVYTPSVISQISLIMCLETICDIQNILYNIGY